MLRLLAAGLLAGLACHASAQEPAVSEDPYLWLEDVGGDKALDWVRQQNKTSLAQLQADPGYEPLRRDLKAILDSEDRIPDVQQMGGHWYNFWKDAQHPRGIWRRTTPAEYAKKQPKWELLLDLDALKTPGPDSLAAIAATLNPEKGTAIITEGLMNYLSPTQASFVWSNIATTLKQFPHGLYLADAYLMNEQRSAGMAAFGAALQMFVRGRMHVHYRSEPEAIATLRAAGFADVALHKAAGLPVNRDIASTRGADRVRILEART